MIHTTMLLQHPVSCRGRVTIVALLVVDESESSVREERERKIEKGRKNEPHRDYKEHQHQ